MPLRWMVDDNVVDEGTFLPGKTLTLESYLPETVPRQLQVFQVYASAMRQLLNHIGVPERRPGPVFVAVRSGEDRYHSDRPWALPEPRGFRKSAAFIFVPDDSPATSGRIFSSRIGRAALRARAGAGVEAGLPGRVIRVGANGSAELGTTIYFARDPELAVEVLTGERLASHMLQNLTQDVAAADDGERSDVAARIELQLPDLRESLPGAYEPPANWSIRPRRATLSGAEGETATLAIDIEAPTPGDAYFAVAFSDPADEGVGETTDAWGINVGADLTVSVITDPSAVPLRLPVFA